MNEEPKPTPEPTPPPPAAKASGAAYQPLTGDALLAAMGERFPGACRAGWEFIGQRIYDLEKASLPEICRWLRDERCFQMLADVTAVNYPDREKRFTLIYNLYSLHDNLRILLRVELGEGESAPTLGGIWPAAGWPEREVFDMFGIRFDGHPDLRRILLPADWTGHPLRKDYPLKGRDAEWIARHVELRPAGQSPSPEAAHE